MGIVIPSQTCQVQTAWVLWKLCLVHCTVWGLRLGVSSVGDHLCDTCSQSAPQQSSSESRAAGTGQCQHAGRMSGSSEREMVRAGHHVNKIRSITVTNHLPHQSVWGEPCLLSPVSRPGRGKSILLICLSCIASGVTSSGLASASAKWEFVVSFTAHLWEWILLQDWTERENNNSRPQ